MGPPQSLAFDMIHDSFMAFRNIINRELRVNLFFTKPSAKFLVGGRACCGARNEL
jgi:hypothetical protein